MAWSYFLEVFQKSEIVKKNTVSERWYMSRSLPDVSKKVEKEENGFEKNGLEDT